MLVRVGIDATSGRWNAPVDPATREFVYVPIPESNALVPELETPFARTVPALDAFWAARRAAEFAPPRSLLTTMSHLDPDFDHLTYGDKPPRVNRINMLERGDILVFYAGLRSIEPPYGLIYAMIGFYVIDEIVPADCVESDRRRENAHTRRVSVDPTHRVVRAAPGRSGRLERCVPIGARCADGHYRLLPGIVEAWGGISSRCGYIQRSGVLPWLNDAVRFHAWFERMNVAVVAHNNPCPR